MGHGPQVAGYAAQKLLQEGRGDQVVSGDCNSPPLRGRGGPEKGLSGPAPCFGLFLGTISAWHSKGAVLLPTGENSIEGGEAPEMVSAPSKNPRMCGFTTTI